jgi:acyl carrier protein
VAIWRQVLGVPIVSCDDNFFDLGGDSLLAARLAAHVREAFGRELSLRIIFDAATLTELASVAGGTASALAVNA